MTDYKDTLNLPNTAFPMKANLAQREPEVLKRWQEGQIYQKLQQHWQGRDKFILHDGPPYANGNLHVGHMLNKTLKDIVLKSQMLNGYATPYVPGWDCHGLPIELNVEKKKGKPGQKVSATEFRQACRDYAKNWVAVQSEEFQRLGVLGDWKNPYLTMNYHYEANIVRALGKVIERGDVKQGHKPVYWCIDCESALAQAEVEYKDKVSESITVRFKVVDEQALLTCFSDQFESGQGAISIPIWTTTPWTLPANEAVALHPKLHYVLIQVDHAISERFVIAATLQAQFAALFENATVKILAQCDGSALEHILLQHPLLDKTVPVVLGDHVTVDAGTGAVHTAPAHGPDDYAIGKKYNLAIENPVLGNGCYKKDLPLLGGQFIFKANTQIINLLEENHSLIKLDQISHSYPHCWRHKSPLIFRATPQWFISMDQEGLREKALREIKNVKWVPAHGEARISTMVENNPDWCISRQRVWGTPIPVFLHKETQTLHPNTLSLIEKVAQKIEESGIEAWYQLDTAELLGDDARDYEKSHDVLDVWFDSGVTHFCVLANTPSLQFPADLYLEGSDQHRGWFQSSLLTSVAMNDCAPYKTVLTHGFVVDEKGYKMSKSLGNVVAPDKIIKTLGADILRLWIAGADYRNDIALSDQIIKRSTDAYRRIRNTARYLLANTNDFDPKQHLVAFEEMLALDRYAVMLAKSLQQTICDDYNNYQFHQIFQKIHHFCAVDMGSFYLDIIKDRQYTMPTHSRARRSAQTAMYHILEAFTLWIAPILTFTAEEIWQYLPGERADSVFFSEWYTGFTAFNETEFSADFWQQVMSVRDCVNKEIEHLRNVGQIGSALAANVVLYCDETLYEQLALLGDELRFILITSSATLCPLDKKGDTAVATILPGVFLNITASSQPKCIRCWHHREDVGHNSKHPEICMRCVENIEGQGEQRQFA